MKKVFISFFTMLLSLTANAEVNSTQNNPSVGNPIITFNVNIVNETGLDITLDGEVRFILGNPDHNGFLFGWLGSYTRTDIGC